MTVITLGHGTQGAALMAGWVGKEQGGEAGLGPTGLGEPEGHRPSCHVPTPKLACVVSVSPVSCWLCFSEPVASWLPASPPRPVSLAKTVGNGVSKLYPQPSIPEPSSRSRRNISRLWEARAMAPMCACGLVAGHAAQPTLGPQVGPRIPGSLSCGWKLGFLKPPPAGGFLPDPWCTLLLHVPGTYQESPSACISRPAHLPPPASVSLQRPWPSSPSTQGGQQAVPAL